MLIKYKLSWTLYQWYIHVIPPRQSKDYKSLEYGTTTNFKADALNKISFTASSISYFYISCVCETATTLGYNAVTFPIKSLVGASSSLDYRLRSPALPPHTQITIMPFLAR